MDTRAHLRDTAEADPHNMEHLGEFMNSFVDTAKEVVRTERDHLTFMLAKRAADTTHKVAGMLITFVLLGILVVMASLGAAFWIGRAMGDLVVGFAVVVGFYALVTVIFMALWKGSVGKRFIVMLMNSFYGH
jgi:hypothetical protein